MENTLLQDVADILDRDLGVLAKEIESTPDDMLWTPAPGVINPTGTLAVHLCGNLRHFIGALLGNDGYVRDRDAEFSHKALPKEQILAEIEATRLAVGAALKKLDPQVLHEIMPGTPPHHAGRTVGFFLIQLCCHFSRHEGQLNYLRRILSSRD